MKKRQLNPLLGGAHEVEGWVVPLKLTHRKHDQGACSNDLNTGV